MSHENIIEDEFNDAGSDLPLLNGGMSDNDWASLDQAMSGLFVESKNIVSQSAIEQKSEASEDADETGANDNQSLADERANLDETVLSIFIEDADEQLRDASYEWGQLSKKSETPTVAETSAIKRVVHTFKGNAGMVGATRLAEVSHELESDFAAVEEGRLNWLDVKQSISDGLDDIKEWVMWIKEPEYIPTFKRGAKDEVVSSEAAKPNELDASAPEVKTAEIKVRKEKVKAVAQSTQQDESVLRLKSRTVDALLKDVGTWGSGQTSLKAQNMALRGYVRGLDESVEQMQRLLREVEISAEAQISARKNEIQDAGEGFDPLELDRFTRLQEAVKIMSEGVYDLTNLHGQLSGVVKQNDDVLLQQMRNFRSAQDTMKEIRLVPLESVSGKLLKVVALASKETGKKTILEFEGDNSRLDRAVLDRLTPVLEHILRNAVAHGVESAEGRAAAGKHAAGKVIVRAESFDDHMIIQCVDDGAGLNTEKIAKKALDNGWVADGVRLSDEEYHQFIFKSGFSTSDAVSSIAGRGVGMDVVKTEVEQLGGTVSIESKAGVGTNFIINVPLTIATSQALMVSAMDEEWALPTQNIVQVHSVRDFEIGEEKNKLNTWNNAPFFHLGNLLSKDEYSKGLEEYNTVIEFKFANQKFYIRVDQILGTDNVVVKPLVEPLASVVGFGGSAYLGEGRMGLLLQPLALIKQKVERANRDTAVINKEKPVEKRQEKTKVMVVDDSMTVRKVTGDLLLNKGMHVILAKDGVDALEQLQNEIPDIILLDLEMPRMNGFEFAEHARNTPKYSGIPIIMITSRTADKHQDMAKTLGINAYLGKPYQEFELMMQINKLVSAAREKK
jgi:chemosensory pili system protein ChpA (sensor histidine kinase/response regulator)